MIPVNIYGNTIYGTTTGSGVKAIGSANIYSNSVYGNALQGIQLGQNTSSSVDYSVYLNTVFENNAADVAGAGITEYNQGTGAISLKIENNTLYQNGQTTGYEIQIWDNLAQLTIFNNLLYASPTRRTYGIYSPETGTVQIDHNLNWRADGNPSIAFRGAFPTWTQWQALGYDIHTTPLNPLLNTKGFTLNSGSPCIGAGIYIQGVTTTPPRDIGAF